MDDAPSVQPLQQGLVGLVVAFKSETNQSQDHLFRDLEPVVRPDQRLEVLGQFDVLPDKFLQVLHAVEPQNEPQLQGSETSAQGDLPMSVIRGGALLLVLEVQGIDVEGVHQPGGVLQPHGGAVEVDQHPLVGVEVEGVGSFDAFEQVTELGADES